MRGRERGLALLAQPCGLDKEWVHSQMAPLHNLMTQQPDHAQFEGFDIWSDQGLHGPAERVLAARFSTPLAGVVALVVRSEDMSFARASKGLAKPMMKYCRVSWCLSALHGAALSSKPMHGRCAALWKPHPVVRPAQSTSCLNVKQA